MTAGPTPGLEPTGTVEDAQLTVPEVAVRLRLSRAFIYARLLAGDIPGVRFGRTWRIPASVVDDLAAHGLPTPVEP